MRCTQWKLFWTVFALSAQSVCLPASIQAQSASLSLRAENRMAKGWGAGGWGNYRFTLKNPTDREAFIVKWTARWEVKGKPFGDAWGGEVNEPLPPGKEWMREEAGLLPEEVARAAKPEKPVMAGTFTLRQGERVLELPYRLEIPEATLPEPLKLVKGKTVGMSLMESRYRSFKHLDRALRWIDQCYSAMIEMTGEKPFNGRRMVFREAPAHPWWAYAGQEMILNTDYVGSTLREFDEGLISFGWVHEVGHNFDEKLGKWYIWNGPSAEWQANFKLAYAFETIPDQSYRIRWTFQAPGFPAPDRNIRLRGVELVERFFLMFGDAYLADPSRKWETLSSDEMHSLFQRLQRVYGWEIFKNWYRAYRRLEDAGMKPPEQAEEKVSLIVAILSAEAKTDLIPVFQRWRFPVTPESVQAMRDRYRIGERTASGTEIAAEDAAGLYERTGAPMDCAILLPETLRRAAVQGGLFLREEGSAQRIPAQYDPGAGRLYWLMSAGKAGRRALRLVESSPAEPLLRAAIDASSGQAMVTEAGRPVLRYNFQTLSPGELLTSISEANRIYARPRSDYIHPLYGLDGEELTKDWSLDHPHHRGIYWAWPEVDFRGERGDLHALQRVFARPIGECRLQSGSVYAQIEAENRWMWEERTPIVRERAVIRVYRATPQGRCIDLTLHFTALEEDVSLARRGTDLYGGLNVRLSAVQEQQIQFYTDPPGVYPRKAFATLRGRFAGAGQTVARFAGAGQTVALTILQHRANPDYPGDWVQYPELNWFQPTFPASGTRWTLKKGQTLTLRYRLWIARTEQVDAALCADQWRVYNDLSLISGGDVSRIQTMHRGKR
jgi:hypothetical protein